MSLLRALKLFVVLFLSRCAYSANPDPCVYSVDANQIINDNQMIPHQCCSARNCIFNTLGDALASIANNTIIDIRSGTVQLSTNVLIENVNNVAIIGRNNPTIFCINSSSIRFVSSDNVTVEGITWQGCGFNNADGFSPVFRFCNSSEVTIQSCSFNDSAGQVLSLSMMSGDVTINNCQFTDNNGFDGKGAAVYFTSLNNNQQPQPALTINSCDFISNGPAESVVYINGSDGNNKTLFLQNSVFISNEGASVQLSHTILHLGGTVMFRQNVANDGAGIHSTNSTVSFDSGSCIHFTNNSADNNGGAIYMSKGTSFLFGNNLEVIFKNNSAVENGGAIFSEVDAITIVTKTSLIVFDNNSGRSGGALYSSGNINVKITGNSVVTFNKNYATGVFRTEGSGGVMYGGDTVAIKIHGNSVARFTNNIANRDGGIVYGAIFVDIVIGGNSTVIFYNNIGRGNGGVISMTEGSLTFEENSVVTFDSNSAGDYGGATYTEHDVDILIIGNSGVTFTNNSACLGGAIYICEYTNITFSSNSVVLFDSNTAIDYGGAIYADDDIDLNIDENSMATFSRNSAERGGVLTVSTRANVTFSDNSVVTFDNNTATETGGAFYIFNMVIRITGNSKIVFNSNHADNGGSFHAREYFGATFDGNSVVAFNNNTADSDGGAVYSDEGGDILITGNSLVTATNNIAGGSGGAFHICAFSGTLRRIGSNQDFFRRDYCKITFNGSSIISFNSNSATDFGGAVYTDRTTVLFSGASSVKFYNNSAKDGGALYCRRNSVASITEDASINFTGNNASNGGAIYHDQSSVSLRSSRTVTFNDNKAMLGGAVFCTANSSVLLGKESDTSFIRNAATNGGGIYAENYCIMSFEGEITSATFTSNSALTGGALYCANRSSVSFEPNSDVSFIHNMATETANLFPEKFCTIIFNGTNECLSTNSAGMCTDNQKCSNTNNVFECSCLDGYIYDSNDPDTCIGVSPNIDEGPFEPQPDPITPGDKTVQIGTPVYVIGGNDITIVCRIASGTPPMTIRWLRNGVEDASFGNVSMITVANVNSINNDGDTFICKVENLIGFDVENSTINVFESPMVVPVTAPPPPPGVVGVSTGDPIDMTINTGTAVTIYCPVTGADTPAIQWFKDGVMLTASGRITISTTTLPGADITSVVTINDFQPADAGAYRCTGTNVVGMDFGEVTLQQQACPTCNPPAVETPSPNPGDCPICGEWLPGPFGDCSLNCHLGVQLRTVVCIDLNRDNITVDDVFCNAATRPTDRQNCGSGPCAIGWRKRPWSTCSKTCQTGHQIREVECIQMGAVVPDSRCDANTRPKSERFCNGHILCQPCQDLYPDFCLKIKGKSKCRIKEYKQACCKSCRRW